MIRSVFRQFYLCVKIVIFFLIPLELAAGDAFRCGDWECTSFGYAKTLNNIDNIYNNDNIISSFACRLTLPLIQTALNQLKLCAGCVNNL